MMFWKIFIFIIKMALGIALANCDMWVGEVGVEGEVVFCW
jgi:hypothetical protein